MAQRRRKHLDHPTSIRRPPDPRASIAALLSFLFPGAGQAYNGERRLAWLLAGPILLAIVVLLGLLAASGSRLLAHLLDARVLIALIVVDVALLGWRLVAIVQAHAARDAAPGARDWTTYATAGLLTVTLAMHAIPAYYAYKGIETIGAVSQAGSGSTGVTMPGFSRLPEPPGQPAQGERINVLLVGIDWKPGRAEHLTDTMLVVSLDPTTGRSAMVSVPRDLYGVRLADGRVYNDKLNSLLIVANGDPTTFPAGGVATLKGAIGQLLGVKIHYFAAINLLGFKQAVDSIGGVDVTVDRAVNDPYYWDEYERNTGFYIQPGRYHMDGHLALAFVRSRMGIGDSDFTRAARQQQILAAIRAKLTASNLLTALPGLLDAVKATITTDIPQDRVPALAQAVQDANIANLQRAVVEPPLVQPATGPGGAYILIPDFTAIRQLGQRLLGDTPAATPTPTPSPAPTP